jgi:hypothetical protein
LASDCDLAAEAALAQAAGLTPQDLPPLRLIARHELLPPLPGSVEGQLPRVTAAPAWKSKLMTTSTAMKQATQRARDDMHAALQNLYRIPDFLRRRLVGETSLGDQPS